MKCVKVELVYEDTFTKTTRLLEGPDAEKWQEYMLHVCMYAQEHGENPKWGYLNWQVFEKQKDK